MFYQSKAIIPSFYLYNLDIQKEFISLLKANKFGFEELISPIQLWNKKILEKVTDDAITIESVTEKNYVEALDIECSIKEFGGRTEPPEKCPKLFSHKKRTIFQPYLLGKNV